MKFKKILSLLLMVLMIITSIPCYSFAAVTTGAFGDDFSWEFDSDAHTLNVHGEGEITDFTSGTNQPWSGKRSYIYYVTFDEGITNIPAYALYGITALKNVYIPSTCTKIGAHAFERCSQITSYNIPASVEYIGDYCFNANTKLINIELPESINSIANYMFQGCTSLQSVSCSDSLISIGKASFLDCTSLINLTVSDCLQDVGVSAFENCSSLQSIPTSATLTNVADSAFKGCSSLINADLSLVENIEPYAFSGCSKLESVIFPENINSIPEYCFENCKSLTEIVIPNGVTSLGNNAFSMCSGAKKLCVPDSVTKVGSSCFAGLSGVKEITVPITLSFSGSGLSKVETVIFTKGIDGIGKDYTSTNYKSVFLYYSRATINSITVSDGITSLGNYTFADLTNLSEVILPEGLISIGNYCFNNCKNISELLVPYSVNTIGSSALPVNASIKGYHTSTAEEYCKNNNKAFTPIHNEEVVSTMIIVSSTGATCQIPGEIGYKCNYCDYEDITYSYADHAPYTSIESKEPTCAESGNTAEVKCLVCGAVITESETIEKLAHSLIAHEGKVATCTEDGYKSYVTCENCDYTTYEVIEKLGHKSSDAVKENEVTASCIENGSYDEVVYCENCNAELSRKNVITEKFNHIPYTSIESKEPTCTDYGNTAEVKCSVCGAVITESETIEKIAHSLVSHEGKAATCTEDGYKSYVTCENCDYTTYEVIEKLGHKSSEAVKENEITASCTETGSYDEVVYCENCNAELSRKNVITEKLNHTPYTSIESKEPTCTESGNTAEVKCLVCGALISESETIEKLAHSLIAHEGKVATCTEDGYKPYVTCENCDYTTYEVIEKLGHKSSDAVKENEVTASCTENGSYDEVVYCENCNAELSRKNIITEKLNHTPYTSIESKEPTCTESGNTVEVKCSVCGTVITESETIEKIAHSLITHEGKSATCTEDGYKSYVTCENCDYTTYEVIDKLGHKRSEVVKANEVIASCTANGSYDEVVYCASCNVELSRKNVITEKLNHTPYTSLESKEPTCTENGNSAEIRCAVCDLLIAESYIKNSIGHTDKNNDHRCDICDLQLQESNSDCNHICHKSGIYRFFYLIARFFWRILGINKICSCGAVHY